MTKFKTHKASIEGGGQPGGGSYGMLVWALRGCFGNPLVLALNALECDSCSMVVLLVFFDLLVWHACFNCCCLLVCFV